MGRAWSGSIRIGGVAIAVLALSLLTAVPGHSKRDAVPARPHVVDADGDATGLYLNEPGPGNRPEADILAAWFTGDREVISVNWLVAESPLGTDLSFDLFATPNPEAPPVPDEVSVVRKGQCYFFTVNFYADSGTAAWGGSNCTEYVPFEGATKVSVRPDGSALVSVSFRRGPAFFLKSGDLLTEPWARSSERLTRPDGTWVHDGRRLDITDRGREFRIP